MSGFKHSATSQTVFTSPIGAHSALRPLSQTLKRKGSAGLLLTSLVDSFSILVIFLISNSSNAYQVKLDSKIKLPAALAGSTLEKSPIVKVRDSRYYINDVEISGAELPSRLAELFPEEAKKEDSLIKPSVIVLADKNLEYGQLNPLVIAASQAGIHELKFAVINKK